MAKDAVDTDDEETAEKPVAAPASGKKKLIIIIVAVIAVIGVSIGGTIVTMRLVGGDQEVTDTGAKKKKTRTAKKADAADDEEAAAEDEAAAEEEAAAEDEREGEGTAADTKEAVYMDFEQPFVVNFMDETQLRYLQVTVAVMSHNSKMAELVKRHMPLIRNNLVMLFSSQTRAQIISREGKEKIRADAQAEVQKILKEQTGDPVIEALYLTSFVMQ